MREKNACVEGKEDIISISAGVECGKLANNPAWTYCIIL